MSLRRVFFYKLPALRASYKRGPLLWLIEVVLKSPSLERTLDIDLSDIIITASNGISELTSYYGRKKIVFCSTQDNANMSAELVNNPNIHLIFDHTKALFEASDPPAFLYLYGNRSRWLLDSRPLLPASADELGNDGDSDNGVAQMDAVRYNNKVKCVFNISNFYHRSFRKVVQPLSERKYDVVFLGKTTYDLKLTELKHRIIDRIHHLGEKYNLRVLATDSVSLLEYTRILTDSKVFVSSYGWGEFSTKEYDCINCGTHVVKSEIFFEACPNIYAHMDSFKLDLSDFDEVVLRCLRDLPGTQTKVNMARELVRTYHKSPPPTAEHLLIGV